MLCMQMQILNVSVCPEHSQNILKRALHKVICKGNHAKQATFIFNTSHDVKKQSNNEAKNLLLWPKGPGNKQYTFNPPFFLCGVQPLSIRRQRWWWFEPYLTPQGPTIYWKWHWTAVTHGYSEAIVKTYTQLIDPVAVRNKLQHLYWGSSWQVGRGFCPIIGGKGWSRIRRATRIDLMRTWYDCCGTAETRAHLCPQQAYSVRREWPEWSGRKSDRDW